MTDYGTDYGGDGGRKYLDHLALMQECIRQGWRMAAGWAKRDDLLADIGSPAYLKEMADFLSAKINPAPGIPEVRVTDLGIDMRESCANFNVDDPLMKDPELIAAATAAVARMEAREKP
jgi:hypothetical protein